MVFLEQWLEFFLLLLENRDIGQGYFKMTAGPKNLVRIIDYLTMNGHTYRHMKTHCSNSDTVFYIRIDVV